MQHENTASTTMALSAAEGDTLHWEMLQLLICLSQCCDSAPVKQEGMMMAMPVVPAQHKPMQPCTATLTKN